MSNPTIGAVVLAAGMSRRMGGQVAKLTLPLRGRPIVRGVVESILAIGQIGTVCVVTGHQRDRLLDAIAGLDVLHVHNPDYAAGEMLSSIQTGIAMMRGRADAVLLALGDQPNIRVQTMRAILAAWQQNPTNRPLLVRPAYRGKHGHPIVIDARGFDKILALDAPATLKTYTAACATRTIDLPVDDPAILQDIDTPGDYERALRDFNSAEQTRSQTCPNATPE